MIEDFRNEQMRHRDQLERQARGIKDALQGDVVIDGSRRLLLRSPDGTYWALGVDDAGDLTTTNAGTAL